MTILQRVGQAAANADSRARVGELVAIMRCLGLAGPSGYQGALAIAQEHRCVDRVTSVLKAAVAMNDMTNSDALAAIKPITDSFLTSIRSASAVQEIASAGGFRAVPLRTALGRVETGSVAYRVEEGVSKPASRMGLVDLGVLEAIKVVAFVIVTSEVFKFGNPLATSVIGDDLAGALAEKFDAVALAELITTSTPSAVASGDPLADVAFLTGSVSLSAGSRPYFVGSTDAIRTLSLYAASGVRTFDTLGINGGELCGVPALVTDALTDELIFLDAAQVAFGDDGVVADVGRHGMIVLDDTGTGSAPVNLFQQNLVAPRLERTFGIAALGANAVAVVTGIGASI